MAFTPPTPFDAVLLPSARLSDSYLPDADDKKRARIRRHACSRCNKVFTTSGHLTRHIRIHTGEKNHKCPFPGCNTRCSRQDNLQQHYRIHLSSCSRRSSGKKSDGAKTPPLTQKGRLPRAISYGQVNPHSSSSPPQMERAPSFEESFEPSGYSLYSMYSWPPNTPPALVEAVPCFRFGQDDALTYPRFPRSHSDTNWSHIPPSRRSSAAYEASAYSDSSAASSPISPIPPSNHPRFTSSSSSSGTCTPSPHSPGGSEHERAPVVCPIPRISQPRPTFPVRDANVHPVAGVDRPAPCDPQTLEYAHDYARAQYYEQWEHHDQPRPRAQRVVKYEYAPHPALQLLQLPRHLRYSYDTVLAHNEQYYSPTEDSGVYYVHASPGDNVYPDDARNVQTSAAGGWAEGVC